MRERPLEAAALADGELVPGLWADLVALAKPRITTMVVVTTGIGLLLGGGGALPVALVLAALLGTGLVSAGASVLNQVMEKETDALMIRTAARPLPAGRMTADQALLFGVLVSLAGLGLLALGVNLLTALLGAMAHAGYLFVYTPLKRRTSLATVIGAVPGAIPPMMGWAAARDAVEPGAWALFALLFLWQLPHFLAIAWLCREDYARAGFPMLPVIEPDGRSTARQAVLYAAALVPASLVPSVLGLSGAPYFIGALVLGTALLGFSIAFSASFSNRSARRLLLASVLYLPAVLVVMLVDSVLGS